MKASSRRIRSTALARLNRILARLDVQLVRAGHGVGPRRIRASLAAFEACHGEVIRGPFLGMRLAPEFTWGEASIGAIALGCYEEQLHPAIEELIERRPDVIVNVGCAEGTYAVGLARRLPNARVIAVDVEPTAERALMTNAALNGVADRVEFGVGLDHDRLAELISGAERPAIVLDCEGCELGLVDPAAVPELSRSDLLIEVHTREHLDAEATLVERLRATHDVQRIAESGRNPHAYPQLRGMPSIDKWLVVCEGRDETMSWLWCRRRATSDPLSSGRPSPEGR